MPCTLETEYVAKGADRERAARLRDEVNELKRELRDLVEAAH